MEAREEKEKEIQELRARLTRVEDQLEKQARETIRRPSLWKGGLIAFIIVFVLTIISFGAFNSS